MNKLTRNIVAFLVTFLVVQVWSMYIIGGFAPAAESKFIASFAGAVLGMAVLFVINDSE